MTNQKFKINRATRVLYSVFLLFVSLTYYSVAQAEVAVITHPSTASTLNAKQVKSIFLGKSKKFPDGSAAIPVDQNEGSTMREAFGSKVLGKSQAQLKSFWSKRIFSGKGTPPNTLAGDAEVKAWVAKTPGAVGYIDGAAVDGSVKVLLKSP